MKKLMILAVLVFCGCTERNRQKGILGMNDPALATQKDVEDLKKIINERFDRLEKKVEND